MKIKIAIIILAVICLQLGIALVATKNKATNSTKWTSLPSEIFSNQLVSARSTERP
jgi:uncharacterized protein YoxC